MSRRDGPKLKTSVWRQVAVLRPHELVALARDAQDLAATMDDGDVKDSLRELFRVARKEIGFFLEKDARRE